YSIAPQDRAHATAQTAAPGTRTASETPPLARHRKTRPETDSRPAPSPAVPSTARLRSPPACSCRLVWDPPQQCNGEARKDWPWARAMSRKRQDISEASHWQLRDELTLRKTVPDLRLQIEYVRSSEICNLKSAIVLKSLHASNRARRSCSLRGCTLRRLPVHGSNRPMVRTHVHQPPTTYQTTRPYLR